jgi:putative transposase
MDERMKFVARLLDGQKMAVLCREFEISRKTGYKIYCRYKDCGVDGVTDRSRRPYRHARQLPFQIEKAIVQLKQEHPSWGAPKIGERLRRAHDEIRCPAISTVHAILDRNGLVKCRRRRLYKPEGTPLAHPHHPNDLWCADYKGEFMLADRRYCYPLTITDFASRYLLGCEALSTTKAMYALTILSVFLRTLGSPGRFAPITEPPLPAPTRSLDSPSCRCGGCA